MRKRKSGMSYAHVTAYARGSGVKKKEFKGTPAYLGERPSPSEVLRAGYGVGARVELIAKQTGFGGNEMDPKFAHPIGSVGTITDHFGADPVVRWDSDPNSNQVVEARKLRVFGKLSSKKGIIASVPYSKLEEFTGPGYHSFHVYEDGNRITLARTEPVFDDVGYEVGDVTYSLVGKKHGTHVDFDTPKMDLSRVPRPQRWVIRNYWESQDPKEMFEGAWE
jgi:hypothetical protein